MSSKGKRILRTVLIVFGISILVLVGLTWYGSWAYKRDQLAHISQSPAPVKHDDFLAQVAEDVNKLCPMTLAEHLVLKNAAALPANTLLYNVQVTDRPSSDVNHELFISINKPKMVNYIRTTPELDYMRAIRTTIIYRYHDWTGNYMLQIVILPKDYSD